MARCTSALVLLLAATGISGDANASNTTAVDDVVALALHDVAIESTRSDKRSLIYLIRHGEKPDDDNDSYLSPRGEERAACLAQKWATFGFTSLFCPDFDPDTNKRGRACQTIRPLSQATGIALNSDFDRDDDQGVAKAILKAAKNGPVLLAWEHKVLADIAKDLSGAKKKYPSEEFDLIWTYNPNKNKFLADSNENC
ncbi:Aste57867_20849 [Aphanomyces stellatus]|uniref:Aste57867_20849 protein n=1 Tax=Aphanomyces stellatus TaxID=120398 RepID=A0A485LFY8_9STRA|nr:hypothetical protein As57867_020781 [Aphanomyces stellatus]VFT97527.1 Aste57867_20849 [Aphanomyces stellatus]